MSSFPIVVSSPVASVERVSYRIFELGIDFRNNFPHLIQFRKHILLRCSTSKHRLHLMNQLASHSPVMRRWERGELTCESIGPNLPPSVDNLPRAFSRTEGKERNRSVCPVGAVSNTITENSIDLTCLPLAPLMESREMRDVLHDFCETHCFVYTGNSKG